MAAAQPPHEALDVEALGASVATHVTDACQVLVERAAATGVEAALAKGRSADHKSALAKAEKAQGNGMQCSRAWCGTPPILGVVNMVGTRNFTCYMGPL